MASMAEDEIHSELRPILSSSASSSTVARSSGLSMARHDWSEEEELALFREVVELLKLPMYLPCRKSLRNAALADRLNTLFDEVAVPFTVCIVKNKLEKFQARWSATNMLKTSRGTIIPCSEAVLAILFAETTSASESTNSGAADSVNVNHGKRMACTLENCVNLVQSIEELSIKEKAIGASLMKSESNRKIFMTWTCPKVRLEWIKREIKLWTDIPLAEHEVED